MRAEGERAWVHRPASIRRLTCADKDQVDSLELYEGSWPDKLRIQCIVHIESRRKREHRRGEYILISKKMARNARVVQPHVWFELEASMS